MENKAEIQEETILSKIFIIRGIKVLLDSDLASLYEIETKVLKRAVRRNLDRFPEDFMFKLNPEENHILRCQIGTIETGKGKFSKYLPFVLQSRELQCFPVF